MTTSIHTSMPSSSNLQSLKTHWTRQLDQLHALINDGLLPPAFAEEVNLLVQSIASFKLAVPLIGKFSAGKSSVVNAWLGQDTQAVDLGPCTFYATEFHYAGSSSPVNPLGLLIHWRLPDGDTRIEQRPLADYATLKDGQFGPLENLQRVELHLDNAALVRFPNIVLVDTPGIFSHDARHTEAVASYLGDGVVFILCANESTLGQEELAFVQRQRSLGQEFYLLQCKQDLLAPGDRDEVFQTLVRQAGIDPARARSCSAHTGQLQGLEEILGAIEADKTQLFAQRLGPQVQNLIAQAQRLLQRQLAQDMSAEQLQTQQHALRRGMASAQRTFQHETENLQADMRGLVARAVRATVGEYLRSRANDYAQALANGQDPSAALTADTRNAVQLAGEQHLTPRLLETAQRIGAEVQRATADLNACDIVIGSMQLDRKAADERAQDSTLNIGTLLALAPLVIAKLPMLPILKVVSSLVTLLAPALSNFFQQNRQEEQRRAQAQTQINQTIDQVLLDLDRQLSTALQAQSQAFLERLRAQFDARLQADQQSLERLEADLQQNQQERSAKETRVRQALETLQTLTTPAA